MPIKWENNILGFVPKTDWLDVPFQITRPNDPADAVFGDLKTDNLVAEWESIASEYQIPVMAQFHGFDVESKTTFRVPIDTHNIEKGLIKVKINQSERLRALLRSGVQGDTALYDYVVRDGARLAEQVITRTKVAKNELLATGAITIKISSSFRSSRAESTVFRSFLDIASTAGRKSHPPECEMP